jgi:hypothetical protein
VNTRTATLTTVSHPAFHLRFSNLHEIEQICKEDPARRAVRAIDWISERIAKKCSSWIASAGDSGLTASNTPKGADAGKGSGLRIVDDATTSEKDFMASPRTPWWDELRRCAEGERVPNLLEGWNHPVAGPYVPIIQTGCYNTNHIQLSLWYLQLFPTPYKLLRHSMHAHLNFQHGWIQHTCGTPW